MAGLLAVKKGTSVYKKNYYLATFAGVIGKHNRNKNFRSPCIHEHAIDKRHLRHMMTLVRYACVSGKPFWYTTQKANKCLRRMDAP